ncbi:succinate-semialdehyde dehydrogenase [Paenibacillus mucilaginosus 3016]|uniref:Succinate-semialdehyde dehydrogenase n=1 Tax=Paenibacillus mucilaginosus 3016 TaxID=1116391 RepID=H6NHC5_9BACL|nr:aldehyde dehydrogenase family protein [Paenibacillus mucilaginosus]AFC29120.1 succinate-semialdehyde dehydrogenase [Paenibacillus mucilaginosus 3016]WFA17860.1 aldehyde dehydrogenase family protein [Paenibacillus mucilaginosus]
MEREQKLFINGEWVSTGQTHHVYNKYTGELFCEVYKAGAHEVNHAVEAAEYAFKHVSFPAEERAAVLTKVAQLLRENVEDIARCIAEEGGKPLKDARVEVGRSANTFQLSAEEAKYLKGELIPSQASPNIGSRLMYTIKKPAGVVCAISPFNFPLNLVTHKVAPALAAGNPVIIKPASDTSVCALKLCELLEQAGVPKGYVHCLVGEGSTVGEMLLKDPRIQIYTFTGSPGVGKHIQETVGMRRTILELGSNSATIVHEDGDVEKAAKKLAKMAFAHAGQVCISVQRIYVHQRVEKAFMDLFIDEVKQLKVGDPLDPLTEVGPMISEKEAKRIEAWVNEAKEAGAQIAIGGSRSRCVYEPTVITGAGKGMKVVDEEVFAPVVTVTSYETIEEAIRQVNDSKYGLQAGVYTGSISLAHRLPYLLEVGGVIINDTCNFRADHMPYGGVKDSGMGKEGPHYAVEEMSETVTVVVNLDE